jgi:hypothetical protein
VQPQWRWRAEGSKGQGRVGVPEGLPAVNTVSARPSLQRACLPQGSERGLAWGYLGGRGLQALALAGQARGLGAVRGLRRGAGRQRLRGRALQLGLLPLPARGACASA